jgi:hypothetical protein
MVRRRGGVSWRALAPGAPACAPARRRCNLRAGHGRARDRPPSGERSRAGGHPADVEAQARQLPGDEAIAVPRLKRIGITVAATLVSINIWTGAPLLAVWVGSRFAPESGTSMGAIVIVLGVLVVSVAALTVALTRLNGAYDRLTGRDTGPRRVAPWLQSMRAERRELSRARVLSPIERMIAISAVAAVIGFEIWFFFFARYSIPGA